jgi:hypothetical protein
MHGESGGPEASETTEPSVLKRGIPAKSYPLKVSVTDELDAGEMRIILEFRANEFGASFEYGVRKFRWTAEPDILKRDSVTGELRLLEICISEHGVVESHVGLELSTIKITFTVEFSSEKRGFAIEYGTSECGRTIDDGVFE